MREDVILQSNIWVIKIHTNILPWADSSIRTPSYFFGLLRQGHDDILLESTMTGKHGRFSYIALDPETVIKSNDGITSINSISSNINPLDAIQQELAKCREMRPDHFPLFYSGAVGFLGYNLKNVIEPRLKTTAKKDTDIPDCYMIFPRVVIGFDNQENKIFISAKDNSRLDVSKLEHIIMKDCLKNRIEGFAAPKGISTNISFEEYKKIFNRAKEYIHAGDCYQVKISIRHEFEMQQDPWNVYQKLSRTNPSPYSAFLDLKDVTLVSCSPEELIRLENRFAETRPIGGTYRRGKTAAEDDIISQEFFNDAKEIAEHVMLIDLERNDLGKVCNIGSVKVTDKMVLDKYANLMHIVTTIRGNLGYTISSFDLIKSMFPGGTVTGCPKIRAMEIIDELEPIARGPYTGSIGFITPDDECQFNIIIRTLAIDKKNQKGYIQVGGGIVADSNAEYEYQEDLRKGKAIVDILFNK